MASKEKDGKDSPAEEQAPEEQAAEPAGNAALIHGLFSAALGGILVDILDRLDKLEKK